MVAKLERDKIYNDENWFMYIVVAETEDTYKLKKINGTDRRHEEFVLVAKDKRMNPRGFDLDNLEEASNERLQLSRKNTEQSIEYHFQEIDRQRKLLSLVSGELEKRGTLDGSDEEN